MRTTPLLVSLALTPLVFPGTLAGPARAVAAENSGTSGTLDINFDNIKFEIQKDAPFKRSMITRDIKKIVGKRIRIRGYIHPSSAFKQEGIKTFILVRDNMECCFGPGAALYDCVIVRMQGDASASYTVRPVTVEGEFSIKIMRDFDDVVRAVYELAGESVK